MKFKVDENLPVEVADALGAAGHDAMRLQPKDCKAHKIRHWLRFAGKKIGYL